MLQRTKRTVTDCKLLDVKDLQAYLAVGRNTALQVGREAGALRKIGRRSLYDREVIDRYIDSLAAL